MYVGSQRNVFFSKSRQKGLTEYRETTDAVFKGDTPGVILATPEAIPCLGRKQILGIWTRRPFSRLPCHEMPAIIMRIYTAGLTLQVPSQMLLRATFRIDLFLERWGQPMLVSQVRPMKSHPSQTNGIHWLICYVITTLLRSLTVTGTLTPS